MAKHTDEEMIEKYMDVTDKSCSWYESLTEIAEMTGEDISHINSEDGELYYELKERLNGLTSEQLETLTADCL